MVVVDGSLSSTFELFGPRKRETIKFLSLLLETWKRGWHGTFTMITTASWLKIPRPFTRNVVKQFCGTIKFSIAENSRNRCRLPWYIYLKHIVNKAKPRPNTSFCIIGISVIIAIFEMTTIREIRNGIEEEREREERKGDGRKRKINSISLNCRPDPRLWSHQVSPLCIVSGYGPSFPILYGLHYSCSPLSVQSFDNRTAVLYIRERAGKWRRKETAPSTILTKQFKRLSCLFSLSRTCGKNRRPRSPMRRGEQEKNGNSIPANIYSSRMCIRTVNLQQNSIFHFSSLQNKFLVLISK